MKNQFQVPVVTIEEVRLSEDGKTANVSYKKVIPSEANVNPFSLGFQLKGHPNAIEQKDKVLLAWVTYHDAQAFINLGWSVGDNVNTKENNPYIVDIIEDETTVLSKNNGLDKEGNVRVEPVQNPQTGAIAQSEDGKMIFRFVRLVYAESLETLEAQVKAAGKIARKRNPVGGVATFDDIFMGEKKVAQNGRNVMTTEYQEFLQTMYTQHNLDVLMQLGQDVTVENTLF